MVNPSALAPYAHHTLPEAFIPELPGCYRGKVRENYDLADGTRVLIATDRISAFDRNLAVIPLKGQVLTQTARFWFEATQRLCPNHVIEYPDPNVLVCKRLAMMPVEIVVRDYLAGTTSTSILQMYKKGSRELYGHRFSEGLRDNQKLPQTIITPTTKAEQGEHDAPLSADDIVTRKLLTEQQWRDVSEKALALFACGREIAARQGLIWSIPSTSLASTRRGQLSWPTRSTPPTAAATGCPPAIPRSSRRARRRTRWTRISSAAGWRRAAILTRTRSPRSRRRSSCRPRPPTSTFMKSSPGG